MRPLPKLAPWLLAALWSAPSVFATTKPAPQLMPNPAPAMSGYSAPARIEVAGSWDAYLSGSFTYWNPSQDNMELGIVETTGNALFSLDGDMVPQNFSYAPGFQVGAGGNLNRDQWDLFAQYTWFRNTDTATASLDPNGTRRLIPLLVKPDSSNPRFFFGQEKWRLSMDLADLELGRSYYVGTDLTFRFAFGARGAFIRQYLNATYLDETTGFLGNRNIFVNQNTNSWAVGPRVGLDSNWLVGQGVRLYGTGSADILFTRYTKLRWQQQATDDDGEVVTGSIFAVRETNVDCIRPHLALELGLAWSTYLASNAYHLDLAAGYNFQVFFSQNMFRTFADDVTAKGIVPNGDLYMHGMSATVRFDF